MNNFGRTSNRIILTHNNIGTLSYSYRSGGQLSLAGWTNGQNVAMSNHSYEYDQYNRLTGIKLNNVNEVSYTLNAIAGVKVDTSNLKKLDWIEKQRIRQPMMFQPFLNSGLSNVFQD